MGTETFKHSTVGGRHFPVPPLPCPATSLSLRLTDRAVTFHGHPATATLRTLRMSRRGRVRPVALPQIISPGGLARLHT